MAQKPIREFNAKQLISQHWDKYFPNFKYEFKSTMVKDGQELKAQAQESDWLKKDGLVVKPDMLFGKRGLNQLVFLKDKSPGDVNFEMAANWIDQNANKETVLICGTKGTLNTFIVESFQSHQESEEFYLAFTCENENDVIYFSTKGGVHVEENWDLVKEIKIPVINATEEEIKDLIGKSIDSSIDNRENLIELISSFYHLFKDFHFSYLEFNPFVLKGSEVQILDVVARVDDTARYLMQSAWKNLDFPAAFGTKELSPIEKKIGQIDENSGASLKLTILNPEGLVWTLVAGGGASVVYADSIANIWGAKEIANYGEYSGNPTKDETYCYAKGVLDLLTSQKDSKGRPKVLIIGGSIANFTDVAKTFDGIIKAFEDMHEKMKEVGVHIFVRRGGPNYEIGLKNIETAAKRLGLFIEVYGPETHLTDIVRKAHLKQKQGAL